MKAYFLGLILPYIYLFLTFAPGSVGLMDVNARLPSDLYRQCMMRSFLIHSS